MIFLPRPGRTPSPSTLTPASVGRPTSTLSPSATRSASNDTAAPTSAGSFSTRKASPGSTRYCFPPVRITAYMLVLSRKGGRSYPGQAGVAREGMLAGMRLLPVLAGVLLGACGCDVEKKDPCETRDCDEWQTVLDDGDEDGDDLGASLFSVNGPAWNDPYFSPGTLGVAPRVG